MTSRPAASFLRCRLGAAASPPPCRAPSLAAAPTERRFVVVLLRGALDGLAAVPPLGERRYAELRGSLALPPSARPTAASRSTASSRSTRRWRRFTRFTRRASCSSSMPRQRLSHALAFRRAGSDGERPRGEDRAKRRLAQPRPRRATPPDDDRRLGIAVGGAVPLLLRGTRAVASWEPPGLPQAAPEFIASLGRLYAQTRCSVPPSPTGSGRRACRGAVLGDDMRAGAARLWPAELQAARRGGRQAARRARRAARRRARDGRLGHPCRSRQRSAGRLAQNLAGLADGLSALAHALGPAWRQTVVVAVTEFGRTVAVNGSGGTDHGTASVALVMGGAVRGGRVARRLARPRPARGESRPARRHRRALGRQGRIARPSRHRRRDARPLGVSGCARTAADGRAGAGLTVSR